VVPHSYKTSAIQQQVNLKFSRSLDLLESKQIKTLSASLAGQSIDLLINNAGYYGPKNAALGCIDSDEWMRVLQINTIAPLKLVEALIPQLALCKHATVAMLSSKMGSMDDNHSGGSYIYRSSKAALNAITKSLAIDLGIKAVALHPGWVKTDMGGTNALITTETAVSGLRQVIAQLTPENSGSFFAYDGTAIPW